MLHRTLSTRLLPWLAAGIVFVPASPPSRPPSTSPTPLAREGRRQTLLEAERGEPIEDEYVSVARVDLNRDGADDIFAFADASYFCGSAGCIPRLYVADGDGWTEAPIDELVNGEPPMWSIAPEPVNGWLALVFDGEGGRATLVWDGTASVVAGD